MPRTLESLVENHRVARERIAHGLPVWSRKINIKAILRRDQDNGSEAHAASVANEIAALLRASIPAAELDIASDSYDESLAEIVEGMEQLRADTYSDDPSYSALKDLNNMLDRLYDWADQERVWLGL